MLREHRVDGHVLAAVAAGLDGLQLHVLQMALGIVDRAWIQRVRGWTDEEWDEAAATLVAADLIPAASPIGDLRQR